MHRLSRRLVLVCGLAVLGAAGTGCGFRWRGANLQLPFRTLRLQGAGAGGEVAQRLSAQLRASGVQVWTAPSPAAAADGVPVPDAVLDLSLDQREWVVVGTTAAGQVRELLLRYRVRFALRTPAGREWIEPTELQQERELSYAETVVLGKEAEEALLFDDMRAALVRQIMVRLAAVRP
ncbi:LPS-assembly lipoprotein LptE [Tepidimonas charontis]|uniref:LPS-assembly lipoprotein LptE n=1 Tax=Tepidimonas charontis TaxID=2267262 RepID=A0A554XBB8_9BURK|nr:LPS assembly lipoprotein LptE [Tepidimonas charontis]TSE33108.1 LPS-assembly lipoprotein LptE [Tepidimonas charontis]